jgi:probable HAF family extracellular repeat protein
MHRALLSAVLSLSVLLSTLVAAQDASYTFTTIDVPDALGMTLAHGINTEGQIVGWFRDAMGNHGFLWDGATFTTIDVPGTQAGTIAYGINTAGEIVGSFRDATGTHGFLWDGTTFTPIKVPGATHTEARGISETGQIVGAFSDGTTWHGFLKDGAAFTTLDVPGATRTEAYGINTAGQIVGWFLTTDAHGFLTDGTTFTTIQVPGAVYTQAHGISESGQIVGVFNIDHTRAQGFLTDGTTFITINAPHPAPTGFYNTGAHGINTAGQIVGEFESLGFHGFLATPVPVDNTPPMITVAASPATLSPPNGKLVDVTVSGTITDGDNGSGVQTSTYQVTDEYGQVQPGGDVTLEPDGRYAFAVRLPASRNGNDRDGRRYTILVSATDGAGNQGSAPATVTVPRN